MWFCADKGKAQKSPYTAKMLRPPKKISFLPSTSCPSCQFCIIMLMLLIAAYPPAKNPRLYGRDSSRPQQPCHNALKINIPAPNK